MCRFNISFYICCPEEEIFSGILWEEQQHLFLISRGTDLALWTKKSKSKQKDTTLPLTSDLWETQCRQATAMIALAPKMETKMKKYSCNVINTCIIKINVHAVDIISYNKVKTSWQKDLLSKFVLHRFIFLLLVLYETNFKKLHCSIASITTNTILNLIHQSTSTYCTSSVSLAAASWETFSPLWDSLHSSLETSLQDTDPFFLTWSIKQFREHAVPPHNGHDYLTTHAFAVYQLQ